MNKKVKWGLIAFIACGLVVWGVYSQLPKLPVKGNFCFNELPTFHVKVNRDEEQGRFNLDSILKQL